MKTIAVATCKGGVGKTFTSLSLAVEMSKRDLGPILVVDMDSSRNATEALLDYRDLEKAKVTVLDIMQSKDRDVDVLSAVHAASDPGKFPNISVLIGDKGMAELDSALRGRNAREKILKRLLANISGHFKICIIDPPPTLSTAVVNSIVAADCVVSPMALDDNSIQGALTVQEIIADAVRDLEIKPPVYIGAFFANFDKANSKGTQDIVANATKLLENNLLSGIKISASSAVREAISAQATLQFEKSHPVARSYADLASLIIDKISIS